jgi:hypothetical protein
MYVSPILKAIEASSLPNEVKIELFKLAAGSRSFVNRRDGIERLFEADRKQAIEMLIATLKVLPDVLRDSESELFYTGYGLADMVVDANDSKTWEALVDAARRSPIRMRAELVGRMSMPVDREKVRNERLKFVASFLDDAEIWKAATRSAAAILQMRQPNQEWTRQDWEELLEDVKTSIAHQRIR